jgi:hypothetical protein
MESILTKRVKLVLVVIIASSVLVFSPALDNFFSADDWFHLRVSQVVSPQEFINFFSFSQTPQFAGSYRPLSTQTFFFLSQSLFGLNPIPYHLLVFLIFSLSLYLLYKVTLEMFGNNRFSCLAVFIYGISATNFTRLYFLSAFQEILLVTLVLASVLAYFRSCRALSLLIFVFALMSKETAIVLPGIILIIDWYRKQLNFRRLVPFFLILSVYGYLRFVHLGGVAGESYIWDFSPKKALNSLFWYGLWSLGAPEFLVDYVGSGLKVLPKFFTDLSSWSYVILAYTLAGCATFAALFLARIETSRKRVALGGSIFIASLLPVIFLPWHKFTLELGLPMVGVSVIVASLITMKSKMSYVFLTIYVLANVSTNFLYLPRHYSVTRAILAQKVYQYFLAEYPSPQVGSYFEFINDTPNYGPEWGSSKQIAQATSGSEMFKLIYHNPKYEIFFTDFPGPRPSGGNKITISTKMFLR